MGTLVGFKKYLSDRWEELDGVENRLLRLQENYENHLEEIRKVREAELEELMDIVLADRSALPEDFNRDLDQASVEAETLFDEKVRKLEEEKAAALEEAETFRQESLKAVRNLRAKNHRLDREEEELKERSALLLEKISAYNEKIRELGHGFGFFSNLFKMKEIADQRDLLEKENSELAARIELLRSRWKEALEKHSSAEEERREAWKKAEERAMSIAAKLEALETRRSRMIARSALERVLEKLKPEHRGGKGPACPRCGTNNDPANHFCWACAFRLQENDPGFEGSLEEMAELNDHFTRFRRGVQACRGIIALVRGLKSGLEALKKSVSEMLDSQSSYSLGTLEIDVPPAALQFSENFTQLAGMVAEHQGLHPQVFADRIEVLIRDRLDEDSIRAYYETMGEELSRQATAQWD